MNEIPRKSLPDAPLSSLRAVQYHRSPESWNNISAAATALFINHFENDDQAPEKVKKIFCEGNNPIVLLFDMSFKGDGELLGFAYITPMPVRDRIQKKMINRALVSTVVSPEHKENPILHDRLVNELEPLLLSTGYDQMERYVGIRDGHSRRLDEQYQNRIITESFGSTTRGEPLRQLVISLFG